MGVRRVSLSFPPGHLTFGSAHECKERAATSIFLYRLGAQMEVNRRDGDTDNFYIILLKEIEEK